jgi:hypothetical protein
MGGCSSKDEGGLSDNASGPTAAGDAASATSSSMRKQSPFPDLVVPRGMSCKDFTVLAARYAPEIALQSVRLVTRKDLLRLARFPTYEELARRRRHVNASHIVGGSTTAGKEEEVQEEKVEETAVLFVTHEWVTHPESSQGLHTRLYADDPGNTQYRHVERFLTETPMGMGITHIYIDVSCLPKNGASGYSGDGSHRRAELNTMTAVSLASYVLCVPGTTLPESGLVASDMTGFTRELACQRDCTFALLFGRPTFLALRLGLKALFVRIESPTCSTVKETADDMQAHGSHLLADVLSAGQGLVRDHRQGSSAAAAARPPRRPGSLDVEYPNFMIAAEEALRTLHNSLGISECPADHYFAVDGDPWALALLALESARTLLPASKGAQEASQQNVRFSSSSTASRPLSVASLPSRRSGVWPAALREGLRTMTASKSVVSQVAPFVLEYLAQVGGTPSLSEHNVALEVLFVAAAVSGLLAEAAGEAELEALQLRDINLDDDGCLNIVRMGMTATGLCALARKVAESGACVRLCEIHLTGNSTAGNGLGWLMRRAPQLWRVSVLEEYIPRDQVLEIGDAMKCVSGLADFSLDSVGLSDDSVSAICNGIVACPMLERLALPGNELGPQGLISLGQALSVAARAPASRLTKLDLSGNSIGGELDLLLSALNPHVGDSDPKGILSLTSLDLAECSLLDPSAIALGHALTTYLAHVTHLDLSCNLLSESGAAAVAPALRGVKGDGGLVYLNLSTNPLGDGGVDALASVISLGESNLRTLLLESVEVADLGVSMLSIAIQSDPRPPLSKLNLRGNYMTQEACDALRAVWLQAKDDLDTSGQTARRASKAMSTPAGPAIESKQALEEDSPGSSPGSGFY